MQDGYSFYPVIHNSKKYIVRIQAELNEQKKICKYIIYEYREKKNIFLGHFGKRVGSNIVPLIKIDKDIFLNLLNISDTDMRIYAKEILKSIFADYESDIVNDLKIKNDIKKVLQWDGNIDN
ncbi:MAG: hypothetical protein K0R54_136 [Clostridiaceae bacterium]|nr:hypothetical protein [Clostridiaceae bacterium]